MKSTGLVFEMRRYVGGDAPPLTVLEDASRYGSDGAFQASGHPLWVKNPAGLWELDFNPNTPDYIVIPASATQLDFTSGDFSIIWRVKIDSLADHRNLFEKGQYPIDGYMTRINTNGSWYFWTCQADANQATLTATGAFVTDTCYTVGMSRVGATITLFRNGVDITSGYGIHINPDSAIAKTARVGIRYDFVTNPLDGKLSYLGIWSRALPAEEHAARHYELSRWG